MTDRRDSRGIPLAWISKLEEDVYQESRRKRAGMTRMQCALLARQKMSDEWKRTSPQKEY